MAKQKLISYTEAVTELEKILLELENDSEVKMEEIAQKVKRSGELLTICKQQLHEIDEELEKILDNLD